MNKEIPQICPCYGKMYSPIFERAYFCSENEIDDISPKNCKNGKYLDCPLFSKWYWRRKSEPMEEIKNDETM